MSVTVKHVKPNPFRDSYMDFLADAEMNGTHVVFFDLETTGTNTETDEILQLGAIRTEVKNGKFVPLLNEDGEPMEYNIYFKPRIPIPKQASDVNGITFDRVADCPYFEERKDEILTIFEGCPYIAGYNNHHFDGPLMMRQIRESGFDISVAGEFDTMLLAMDTFDIGEVDNYRLVTMKKRITPDFDEATAHDAIVDVRNTIDVANTCFPLFFEKSIPCGTQDTEIKSIKYWKSPNQGQLEKIYVETSNGRIEYDHMKRAWLDRTGFFDIVNCERFYEQFLEEVSFNSGEIVRDMWGVLKILRPKKK